MTIRRFLPPCSISIIRQAFADDSLGIFQHVSIGRPPARRFFLCGLAAAILHRDG